MRNFVLTPYSHWILWAGIALLLVFLIITGIRTVPLVKALSKMQKEDIAHIKEGVTDVKIKTDAIKEKHEETKKKLQPAAVLLPLLIATLKNYHADEEKKGVKGMRRAADEVILKKAEKEKIRDYLKNKLDRMSSTKV